MNVLQKLTIVAFILTILFLLGLTVTPTPTPTETEVIPPTYVAILGGTEVPEGMTPDGITITLYDEVPTLVGTGVTGADGSFHIISANSTPGTFRIIATKGELHGDTFIGLGPGDNDLGVLSLEKVRVIKLRA